MDLKLSSKRNEGFFAFQNVPFNTPSSFLSHSHAQSEMLNLVPQLSQIQHAFPNIPHLLYSFLSVKTSIFSRLTSVLFTSACFDHSFTQIVTFLPMKDLCLANWCSVVDEIPDLGLHKTSTNSFKMYHCVWQLQRHLHF